MPENSNSNSWSQWIPVIGGAFNAIGNIGQGKKNRKAMQQMNQANIDAQLRLNQENRDFSKEMWNLTNQYNSPSQIMERYKAAGLNPHLIYGQQPQASQPMSASTGAPHSEALPADTTINEIGSSMFQATQNYIATKKQQVETDNLQKARDVMDADITEKNARTAESIQRNARSKFDLELAQDLRENTVENAILNTKNLDLQGKKIAQEIQNLDVNKKLTTAQIAKVAQEISYTRQQIDLLKLQGKNLEAETTLKRAELKLRKEGLSFSDNVFLRLFNSGVGGLSDYGSDLLKGIKTNTNRWFYNSQK